MRLVLATVAAVALLTIPAGAQSPGSIGQLPTKDSPGDHTKDENHAIPADDKAYRSALDGIPQIKDHDPWRSVRQPPKSKTRGNAAQRAVCSPRGVIAPLPAGPCAGANAGIVLPGAEDGSRVQRWISV
jgi:hypothetical protein